MPQKRLSSCYYNVVICVVICQTITINNSQSTTHSLVVKYKPFI